MTAATPAPEGPRRLLALARCRQAVSAVEFTLLSPLFCLLMAGAIDFGGASYIKFNLDGAVSSAANYALINAGNVSSSGGASLAANLAAVVSSTYASNWASAVVVVNNGPSMTRTAGVATAGGTAANADSCWCPTLGASSLTWGTATTCGGTCTGGAVAGKFVTIKASRAYVPFFPALAVLTSSTITASTTVQTN